MATPSNLARLARLLTTLVSLALGGVACDQYQRFGETGESLGPVDPVNFPPANLGARGDRLRPGLGTFAPVAANAAGMPAAYYAYPVPPSLLAAMGDPLLLTEKGAPNPRFATPATYAFEQNCQAPPGYTWSVDRKQQDEVRRDQQGAVFTALPRATYTAGVEVSSTYVPVVTEVPVSASGLPCQQVKSEKSVKEGGRTLEPSGKYLAWLIIDPAATVLAPGEVPTEKRPGGDVAQKWGWFNNYLLAYLDGGRIPVQAGRIVSSTRAACPDPQPPEVECHDVTRMVPQKLYHPRSMVLVTRTGPDGMPVDAPAAGRIGAGWDVLQARRGEEGYSPICQVFTYDTVMPVKAAELPKDAATIEMNFNQMATPIRPATPPFVYCLQVEQ